MIGTLLLISTPLLPLLLAFPALRSHLPRPCHIALLPAFILVMLPMPVSVELPWLLLGSSGLAIDAAGRLVLVVSLLLWGAAISLSSVATEVAENDRFATFLLLTIAGSLGAILAPDLVGFFAFSALMGYAFYGLLITGGGNTARRAARLYLVVLILADLALFEALLITAAASEDLNFITARQTVALSPSSTLYLSMVLIGFAAKAAIWPLHFWLLPLFRSNRPALLLTAAPVVVIALLGIARWLPFGEITSPDLGLAIQVLGIAAMLHALSKGLKSAQSKRPGAYAFIFISGLFSASVGTALADPTENPAYLFIATCLGFGVVISIGIAVWLQSRRHYFNTAENQVDDPKLWFERWSGMALHWGTRLGLDTLPRLLASWLVKMSRLRPNHTWQKVLDGGERFLQRWPYAITLLLGIVIVVFASALSWIL